MFEIAGGIVLFIVGFLLLQVVFVAVASVFHAINDWYYSVRRQVRARESDPSTPLL